MVYELRGCEFGSRYTQLNLSFSTIASFFRKEGLGIQATLEYGLTLEHVRDIIRPFNQIRNWLPYFYYCLNSCKKRKDSLEGSLVRVLFAAELEFPKDTSTKATSAYIRCKPWKCWKIKTTVLFMWKSSSTSDMS